jgi:drug/metabolite transporter (DMT)-like permease
MVFNGYTNKAKPVTPGVLAAFTAIYLIWGSTYLAIKTAIVTIPPFTMTATRSLLAGAVLYSWGRWRGAPPPRAIHWLGGSLVGGCMFLGGHGGLGWAETRVPSGVASLFIATIPLWMTLIEVISDGRPRRPARTALGLATGLGGIFLLVGPTTFLAGDQTDPLGAMVLVFAALSWSVGSAVARRVSHPDSVPVATGTYLLSGGLLVGLCGMALGELRDFDPAGVTRVSLGALAYLVVCGSVVTFGAYSWLLRRASLAAVSTYAFVNPVVAVGLGWAIGGETLSPRVIVAAALVLAAVVLILTGRSNGPAERSFDQPTSAATSAATVSETFRAREAT